jgi:hypothetical protein
MFKSICLIIFTVIGILFTVGYAALPLISSQLNIPSPVGGDLGVSNVSANVTLYINSFTQLINNAASTYSSINYSDLSSISGITNIIFKTLLYLCVAVSCLLALGILLALFGLKFFSKIIFLIALILMSIVFILITLIVTKSSEVKDITNFFSSGGSSSINYKSGGILVIVSTALMFVNYLLYAFLG